MVTPPNPTFRRGFLALLLLGATLPLLAQEVTVENAFPNLTFRFPVDIQNAGDGTDRLFVVGQEGFVWVFQNDENTTTRTTFLDIRTRIEFGGELGLLGLAFHPDYETNGFFYVHYTADNPLRNVISRFNVSATDPDVADPNSELVLLEVNQPFTNHNGGQIAFGPDGYLYIAIGDGGSSGDPLETGQDRTDLLGNLLRIDVDNTDPGLHYAIPPDNPFVDNTEGFREEIWVYGTRNPWRFSFDANGRLWIADVGQDSWEEISWGSAGLNLGWDVMEATHCFEPFNGCDMTGLTLPIHEYPHDFVTGGFSITGGHVYTGTSCPALTGQYVYGDFVSQNLWALTFDDNGAVSNAVIAPDAALGVTAFGLDEAGELYVTSYATNGTLHRFVCEAALSITLTPLNPPIILPPTGGQVRGQAVITNSNGASQTFQFWTVLTFPSGNTRTGMQPATITLDAGQSTTRNVRQNIPANAPAGVYTLTGHVGTFPSPIEASSSFTFEKQAASGKADGPVSDEEEFAPTAAVPTQVVLHRNYPNPFNPVTTFRFELPAAAPVRLVVYDLMGRVVAVLVDGVQEAGVHTVAFDATTLPSGTYLYRLENPQGRLTRTMTVMK
jgi:glucose/arabinose dehydrogenase